MTVLPREGDTLLTLNEVCAILKVKKWQLHKLRAKFNLPEVRLSPQIIRVREADLDAWLKARRYYTRGRRRA